MNFLTVLTSFTFINIIVGSQEIDTQYLRCLVCRSTINEIEAQLAKIDPNVQVEVGNYRLDAQGNTIQKKVSKSRSEIYISDILDDICQKMSDYVRARYKSNGQLTILNLLSPSGGMNPEMSKVDIIQDSDMNKSLQFYCEGIVEEYEESIIALFQEGAKDARSRLCTNTANLCNPQDFLTEDDTNTETEEASDQNDEL